MAATPTERQRRHREQRRAMLAAPSLVRKVADPEVPTEALEPYEQAVREVRLSILRDLGGEPALSTAKVLQVDALVSRWIVVQMLDLDVLRLARAGRLLDLRSRRATPLLLDWDRLTGSYERALREVGLDRIDPANEQAAQLRALDERLEAARRPQEPAGGRSPGNGRPGARSAAPSVLPEF